MITDPKPYADKFQSIGERAGELLSKFESGEYTYRDIAIIDNLMQQYCEMLEEIVFEGVDCNEAVVVKVESKTIRFPDIDKTSEFLAGLMR